jgi:hypothetical protein
MLDGYGPQARIAWASWLGTGLVWPITLEMRPRKTLFERRRFRGNKTRPKKLFTGTFQSEGRTRRVRRLTSRPSWSSPNPSSTWNGALRA